MHADGLRFPEHCPGVFRISHDRTFGDLELQRGRVDVCGFNFFPDVRHQIGVH
jgi:hypothetical protein